MTGHKDFCECDRCKLVKTNVNLSMFTLDEIKRLVHVKAQFDRYAWGEFHLDPPIAA